MKNPFLKKGGKAANATSRLKRDLDSLAPKGALRFEPPVQRAFIKQKIGFQMKIYWIALAICLGSFLQSYTTCVIAGALLFISEEFQLTALQQGHVASFILIGAMCGVFSSGYLADRFGRRRLLLLAIWIYVLTSIASLLAISFGSLLILRFITGLAVGITSMLVPMFLAEIAPTEKRGAFVNGYQFSLAIGTLVAYGVNFWGSYHQQDWRWMFFLTLIPAAIQLLCYPFIPESPKWLHSRETIDKIKKPQTRMFSRPFWFILTIGIVLSSFQQLSGINAIIYFTPKIFSDAGFQDPKSAIFATFCVGIVNVFATLLTFFLVDRMGRRKLLLFSQFGIVISLFGIILAFATESQFIDLISVGALLFYIFAYAIGLGPVVWILIAEIFPLSIRARALSLMTFINWSSTYIIVLVFPYLVSTLKSAWTFSIFEVLSLGALGFFIRYIPETKGKSLEEIEKKLVFKNRNSDESSHVG